MAKKKRNKGLADPSRPWHLWMRTGRNSFKSSLKLRREGRNKYAFDTEDRIFGLKKVLPAGMTFPYDFGFVPSTVAEDGDPVDVLVLMDEPAFPGCLLKCRIVGNHSGRTGRRW